MFSGRSGGFKDDFFHINTLKAKFHIDILPWIYPWDFYGPSARSKSETKQTGLFFKHNKLIPLPQSFIMSDPTQFTIPRHPQALVQEVDAELRDLSPADLVLYTTDSTLEWLHEDIRRLIERGARWDQLEVYFRRRGFADLTAVAYYDWLDRTGRRHESL